MALAESNRQPFYLRTFFRLLSSWVHRSKRWSKDCSRSGPAVVPSCVGQACAAMGHESRASHYLRLALVLARVFLVIPLWVPMQVVLDDLPPEFRTVAVRGWHPDIRSLVPRFEAERAEQLNCLLFVKTE